MAAFAADSFVSAAEIGSSIEPDTSTRKSTFARLRTSGKRLLTAATTS